MNIQRTGDTLADTALREQLGLPPAPSALSSNGDTLMPAEHWELGPRVHHYLDMDEDKHGEQRQRLSASTDPKDRDDAAAAEEAWRLRQNHNPTVTIGGLPPQIWGRFESDMLAHFAKRE